MSFEEMAWQLAEVFHELDVDEINEMLARNVPVDALGFIAEYAGDFGKAANLEPETSARLPNLMLMGYLLRVVEERLDPQRREL